MRHRSVSVLAFLFVLVHAVTTVETPVLDYIEQLWSNSIVTEYSWLIFAFPRDQLTSLLTPTAVGTTTFEDMIGLRSRLPESYGMLLMSIASVVTSAVLTASVTAAAD